MDYKLNKSLWSSFGDRFQRNGSSFFLHRQISSALPPPIGGVFRRKDEEGLLFILNVVFSSSSPGGIIAACGKEGGGLLPPPPPPWQLRQAREFHHLCRSDRQTRERRGGKFISERRTQLDCEAALFENRALVSFNYTSSWYPSQFSP